MRRNLKKIFAPANIVNIAKKIVFYELAAFIGIIVALKLFFPGNYIVSLINDVLLKSDYAIKAAGTDYAILKSLSFEDLSVTESGKKIISVQNAEVSPSIGTLIGFSKSADFSMEDFNSSGGELTGSIDIDKNETCMDTDMDEVPFLILKMLLPDMVGKGVIDGTFSFCKSKKINGEIDIKGKNLTFGGSIKGFSIKTIKLGSLNLQASIKDNKITIKKAELSGDLKIKIEGKIILNPSRLNFSRPELIVTISEAEKGTIASLSPLDFALAKFKDDKQKESLTYKFSVKGIFTNPSIKKERSK